MSMKLNDDEIKFDFSFFESDDSLLNMSMTRIKKESRKRSKSNMKVLFIFISIISCLVFFCGKKTKEFSLLIFANNNYKRCTLLNKLDLYQYNIRYIFLFYMYSYLNIYSTFCYLVMDIIINTINDIIRVEIFDSRPFWDNKKDVFPCKCELTPSLPSPISCSSVLFMSLYYFLKKEQKNNRLKPPTNHKKFKIHRESDDENSELKEEGSSNNLSHSQYDKYSNIRLNILLFFLIALIIFVDTIPLLQNIEYLHQSFFGLCLGFSFYYWVFRVVKIDHLNRKHFWKIIAQPWIVMTFCIILLILILFVHNNVHKRLLISNIINIQKFCEIPKNLNFNKEILDNGILLFEIFGAYCGLLLELKITFNSKYDLFIFYNVKGKNGNGYFEEKGPFIKLIRFLLLFFIEIVFFKTIIEFWIQHNLWGWLRFLSLSIVYFFKGIFFFYIMKIILRKLGLINDKIFEEDFNERDVYFR